MQHATYGALPQALKLRLKEANVFFSQSYADFIAACGETLYFLFDEERVIPIRYRQKLCFRWAVFSSEPYCLTGAAEKPLEQYLDEVMTFLRDELNVQWATSTASGFFSDTPSRGSRIPFGSHVIDLTEGEDTLWGRVHSKHRNVIRKAEKEGVTVKSGGMELLDDYLLLDRATWARSQSASSGRAYYARQLETMGDSIRVYLAEWNGVPQAGAIFYVNPAMCYYMYGSSADRPLTGAANLLQWTAIRDMKAAGVKKFSFVGCRINEDENSKYHGIQRFKERFGGTLEQGYLFRTVCSPVHYRLFGLAVQIRTRSWKPYRDAIDEELPKWQSIQKGGDHPC